MSYAALLPIVAEIRIDAPIAHVWEIMTSEATVPHWLGCIGYKPEIGTTFYMQEDEEKRKAGNTAGATHCDVVLIEPPHKFDFTWYIPGTPETLVQISLFSEGPDRSFVRLIHDGWDDFEPEAVSEFHAILREEWKSGVLPALKRVAER